jgi:DNA-binding NtrC family response regulator
LPRKAHLLLVDDDPNTLASLSRAFRLAGHEATVCDNAVRAIELLRSEAFDLILSDVVMPGKSGLELLEDLKLAGVKTPIVLISGQANIEMAVKATKLGALDFLEKPLSTDKLLVTVENALRLSLLEEENRELKQKLGKHELVGSGPAMKKLLAEIDRVAAGETRVCILGETGTGKELVARAIHQHSKRKDQPFTPVNCGSFTETILESELFGHEKGAFTGAANAHRGMVESSDGGTMFLDEISETTLSFQVKLLRMIQEQQVRRVGSNKYTAVDVRWLAASNRDISQVLKQGQFREDLYYRLAVVRIDLPSLEERREDIPLLVAHFLRRFNEKNGLHVTIDPAAVQLLQQRQWPGNVRELENTVNRLAIFAPTGEITLADVEAETQRAPDEVEEVPAAAPAAPDRLLELERQHILQILKQTGGNRSEAARRLGIERKTLYRKALRLGIDLQSTSEK